MIKFQSTESSVTCSCGQPAIRRTVKVSYGGKGSRMVSFDSHSQSLLDPECIAALGRLDAFHKKLYQLLIDLKAFTEEQRKVESNEAVGRIKSFELETVHPDAHTVRTEIIPTAVIQSFGQKRVVRLSARPLEGQTVLGILSETRDAADSIIKAIKKQKDEGDY
mgnify:CR=1 FL=1